MATQGAFWPFFTGCLLLGGGTAIFKPPVQGTFVKTLIEKTSGVIWGIFYMVVNIGSFTGKTIVAPIRIDLGVDRVPLFSAADAAVALIVRR